MTTAYDDARADILERLAECEPGWASAVQLSFEVAGDDAVERSHVRRAINELCRSQIIERIFARHRDDSMPVVNIDPAAILRYRAKVAGSDR